MIVLIKQFAADPKVIILAVLVLLDVILGTIAAVKTHTFSLGRVSDFLRDDVLFKLVPYYALWAAVKVGGDVVVPGLDFGVLESGAFALIAAALVGSLIGSLRELGLTQIPKEADGG